MKFNIVSSVVKAFLLIAIFVASNPSLASANETLAAISSDQKHSEINVYFNRLLELEAIKGVAVSIVDKEHTIFKLVEGVQSSDGQPLTADTAMAIGSISKPFVAAIVLRLADQDLLTLDQPIIDFIPTLSLINSFNDKPVLIQHLLQHRSGIPALDGNQNQGAIDMSSNALASAAMSYNGTQLSYPPGDKFVYSNANYQLLAHIIELVTQRSYESAVQEFILTPLRMDHSFADRQNIPGIDIASGFQKSMWSYKTISTVQSRVTLPQEGLYVSLNDMSFFLQAALRNQPVFLGNSMIETHQANSERRVDYGYGWFVTDYHGQRLVFHFGQSPGFESVVALFPELGLGFVVLTNTQSAFGQTNVTDAIGNILPILFDQPLNPNSPNIIDRSIFYILNSGLMLMLFWAATVIKKMIVQDSEPSAKRTTNKPLFAIVNLSLLILIYVVLIGIPQFLQTSLAAVKLYEPNMYWLIIVMSGSALLVIAARSYLLYKALRYSD
jgi:CubicO group peptidase (beta-lactamase class C family)